VTRQHTEKSTEWQNIYFYLTNIVEQPIDQQAPLYINFIDFQKALAETDSGKFLSDME
jgi:hypothetical protein